MAMDSATLKLVTRGCYVMLPVTQVAPDVYSVDFASLDLAALQSEQSTAASRPRKRLRGSIAQNAGGEAFKVSRPRNGQLSQLLDMPLDIFFEIASHLHPLDLLHLARTSRMLRSILLSRKSRSVWKECFSSIGQSFPPCPPEIEEPTYAALIFDRVCFLCGAEHANWVDYAIQLRLCKACCKVNIRKGSSIVPKDSTQNVLRLVPCVVGHDPEDAGAFLEPSSHGLRHSYYVKDVEAMLAEDLHLPDLPANAKEQCRAAEAKMQVKTKNALAILSWEHAVKTDKALATMRARTNRVTSIHLRLTSMGYTVHDFPEKDDEVWMQLISQPKELTDRIWNIICPKLEARIAIRREQLVAKELQGRVDARLNQITWYYETTVILGMPKDERILMPNTYEFQRLPCIAALARANNARGDVSYMSFLSTTPQMLVEIEEYKVRAKDAIVAQVIFKQLGHAWKSMDVKTLKALESAPSQEILQRYFSYFVCQGKGCHILNRTFEEMHAHWRDAHPYQPWLGRVALGEEGAGRKDSPSVNIAGWIETLAGAMLKLCDIPSDTPRSMLDEWVQCGRLYCTCGDPAMPSPGQLNFIKLVRHVSVHQQAYLQCKYEIKKTAKPHPEHILKNTHSLLATNPNRPIRFLSEDADTSSAFERTKIDEATRTKIAERLNAGAQGSRPVCRICKGMLRTLPFKKLFSFVSFAADCPERIVWHLRNAHDKEFETKDVLFEPVS